MGVLRAAVISYSYASYTGHVVSGTYDGGSSAPAASTSAPAKPNTAVPQQQQQQHP